MGALLGGGIISSILKDLEREKNFEGKQFFYGGENCKGGNFLGKKSGSWAKNSGFQKKGRQKFMGLVKLRGGGKVKIRPGWPGLQICVQHWGDNQHILVTFRYLGG